jgi:hypothetical protein
MFDGLNRYFGSEQQPNEVFFTLTRQLGPGTFRMGGNSQDEVCWLGSTIAPLPHMCKGSLSLSDFQSYALAFKQTGWHVMVGANLGQNSSAYARRAAVEGMLPAFEQGGLLALEIGNEPDSLYTHRISTNGPAYRPEGYSGSDYAREFSEYRAAFLEDPSTRDIPFAGPAVNLFATGWRGPWLGTFLDSVGMANVAVATRHIYAVGGCGGKPVAMADLLAPRTLSNMEAEVRANVAAAAERGVELQISETNSISCGGRKGISDTFSAAAWGLDWMLDLARLGVRRINFHTANANYAVVQSTLASNEARPLFYAMHLFAAASNQRFLPVSVESAANVRAYALTGCETCPVTVFLINKDMSSSADAELAVDGAAGRATLMLAKAPALDSPVSAFDYGGQAVDRSTGLMRGAAARTPVLRDEGGRYRFHLPHAAIALLTIPRSPDEPSETRIDTVELSERTAEIRGVNLALYPQNGPPANILGGSRVLMDDVPLKVLSADRESLVVELPDSAGDGQRRIAVTTGAWVAEVVSDILVGRSQSAGIKH